MSKKCTEKIRIALKKGLSYAEIARRFKITKPSVHYHARKLGITQPLPSTNWKPLQALYDTGLTVGECCRRLDVSKNAASRAIARGDLVVQNRSRHPYVSAADYAVANWGNNTRSIRAHLKEKLLREKILVAKCYVCGLIDWLGKPIILILDHINGIGHDHRIENLRLVCPNCDSQSDTYSFRNVGRYDGHEIKARSNENRQHT
jgi:predicted DNA-binding protein YlxM (UPF0122 family)